MPKAAEVQYVANLSKVLQVPLQEVEQYLTLKPFCDPARGTYVLDIAQILRLLPPPPARLLDLGCGSGWTSEIFARCGYRVLGVDIAPDMIAIARRRMTESLQLSFDVSDYEDEAVEAGGFDAAVIYDALHHSEDDRRVIVNAFHSLRAGGLLITIEPGVGHSATEATRDVVTRYGTTERDMPYARQQVFMREAGFSEVRQYLRLNQLTLESLDTDEGRTAQVRHFQALLDATIRAGLTSVVVAMK
jgi:SAM-dependent methyltransferase